MVGSVLLSSALASSALKVSAIATRTSAAEECSQRGGDDDDARRRVDTETWDAQLLLALGVADEPHRVRATSTEGFSG